MLRRHQLPSLGALVRTQSSHTYPIQSYIPNPVVHTQSGRTNPTRRPNSQHRTAAANGCLWPAFVTIETGATSAVRSKYELWCVMSVLCRERAYWVMHASCTSHRTTPLTIWAGQDEVQLTERYAAVRSVRNGTAGANQEVSLKSTANNKRFAVDSCTHHSYTHLGGPGGATTCPRQVYDICKGADSQC